MCPACHNKSSSEKHKRNKKRKESDKKNDVKALTQLLLPFGDVDTLFHGESNKERGVTMAVKGKVKSKGGRPANPQNEMKDEKGNKKQPNFVCWLPPTLKGQIKIAATVLDTSTSKIVREALADWYEEHRKDVADIVSGKMKQSDDDEDTEVEDEETDEEETEDEEE